MTPRFRSRNNFIDATSVKTVIARDFGVQSIQTVYLPRLAGNRIERIADEVGPEFRMAQRHGSFLVRNVSHQSSEIVHVKLNYNGTTGLTDSGGSEVAYRAVSADVPQSVYDYEPSWGVFRKLRANEDPEAAVGIAFPHELGLGYIKSLVLQNAYAKANEADYQSLVAAAEFEKTLQSAERLASLMPRMGAWLRRNRSKLLTPRGILRATGNLAAQWLEYRYGFMQLYYDWQSVVKVLNRKNTKYRIHVASWSSRSGRVFFENEYDENPISKIVLRRFGVREDVVRAGVVIAVKPYYDITRSLGLHHPLTTLWELTPFSFVWDWCADMSSALGGLEGRFLLQPVASWTSHRLNWESDDSRNRLCRNIEWNGGRWWLAGEYDTASQERYTSYVREASPLYRFVAPPINAKLNWKRFADIGSLIRSTVHNALR